MTRWPRRLTLAANQTELDVRKRALAHRCDTLRWNVTEAYQTGYDAGYGAAMAEALTAYPAPERAILLDLIAELRGYQEDLDATERALDAYGECLCDVAGQAGLCTMHNPRRVVNMADHAEARLREVRGE